MNYFIYKKEIDIPLIYYMELTYAEVCHVRRELQINLALLCL